MRGVEGGPTERRGLLGCRKLEVRVQNMSGNQSDDQREHVRENSGFRAL